MCQFCAIWQTALLSLFKVNFDRDSGEPWSMAPKWPQWFFLDIFKSGRERNEFQLQKARKWAVGKNSGLL